MEKGQLVEVKIEDILSTAVLTTADNPLTLGNVNLDLNNGATAVSTKELDVLSCAVGTGNGYELHSRTAGAVLDKEGKLTCAGNVNLDLGGGVTDLNRSYVLNALEGLGSVSDLGACYDGELAVDGVSVKGTCRKVGDVKRVVYSLHIFGEIFLAADVTSIVAVFIYALGELLVTNCAVVRAFGCRALGERLATYGAVVRALCCRTLGEGLAAYRAVVRALCCRTLGEGLAANRAVMAAVCCRTFGELFATAVAVVVLVLVLMLARSRGVVFLKLCVTVVADVVAVSVYVLFTGLVEEIAKSGDLINSGDLGNKIAGRKSEHGNDKNSY